jgi:hypothetical protein
MNDDVVFIVAVVLAGGAFVWWYLHRNGTSLTGYTYAQVPPPSLDAQLESYSTAGCEVGSRVAGVPMPGGVCRYTPFNIALRNKGNIVSVGHSFANQAENVGKKVVTLGGIL